MDTMSFVCPVCGYPGLYESPYYSEGGGSYEICPSCGIQFGYSDGAGGNVDKRRRVHQEWRRRWVERGMPWHGVGRKSPPDWNPQEQLKRVDALSQCRSEAISDRCATQGTNRWLLCYWQERCELLDALPCQAGIVSKGVLMLPPPVEDLAEAKGLWKELNQGLGTLIDVAEKEDLLVDRLLSAVSIIVRFVDRVRTTEPYYCRATVAQRVVPDPTPLVAELPTSEFAGYLHVLADFLVDAAKQGKPVTISL